MLHVIQDYFEKIIPGRISLVLMASDFSFGLGKVTW